MEPDQADEQAFSYMSDLDDDEINLRLIIENDNLREFKRVPETRKSVNFLTDHMSALTLAVCYESDDIFNFLTAIPPDVDLKTRSRTALLFETIFRSYVTRSPANNLALKRFIISLIKKGADVNLASTYGYSPLYAACSTGLDECIFTLLSFSADLGMRTQDGYLPIHAAASAMCSTQTLEILFALTYSGFEPIQLHILTLTKLIRHNHLCLVRKILPRISSIFVPSTWTTEYVTILVTHLYNVPYWMFMEFTRKCPTILEHIAMFKSLDLGGLFKKNPDAIEYLRFFWTHCNNLDEFDVLTLQFKPVKTSYQLLSELIYTLLARGVLLEIDLDLLYERYQFSPLFEHLLHMKIVFLKDPIDPCFVPVWYNTRLVAAVPILPRREFQDRDCYFAGKERVPTLVQLSRDACRESLLQHFDVNDNVEWARVIQDLPITKDCKDILKFKRRIY